MKKNYFFGLIIILIGFLVTAIATYRYLHTEAEINQATKQIFSGTENQFTYVDIQGNPVSLESFLGQPVVVTTWASWSPFSATDLPAIDSLAKEYAEKNVTFLAINRKESIEQAQRYLSTIMPLTAAQVIVDTEDYFYQSVGGYAMPETVIFDQAGTIVLHTHGTVVIDEIKATIDPLLAS